MSESLTPTEGARFLLERERELAEGTSAVYRTAIYTPDTTFTGVATLADDGTATVAHPISAGAAPTKAPEDLVAKLRMLAKLTARSASKKREDGLPPWPSRVLRWRGPGRGE